MTQPGLITRPALAEFAKQLRAARIHSGLSLDRLAQRTGMTRQGLIKIEKGRNVTLATIILIAKALNCQVGDFFPRKAPWD
jgi:transcriptional regulator with XRE-family HTH domain